MNGMCAEAAVIIFGLVMVAAASFTAVVLEDMWDAPVLAGLVAYAVWTLIALGVVWGALTVGLIVD